MKELEIKEKQRERGENYLMMAEVFEEIYCIQERMYWLSQDRDEVDIESTFKECVQMFVNGEKQIQRLSRCEDYPVLQL